MTVTLEAPAVTLCPVAGCADLARARQAATRCYAMIATAPLHEIDGSARRAMAALAGGPSLRSGTETRLRTAAAASGDGMRQRARETFLAGATLFRALATQARGPQLLAAARGAQLRAPKGRLVIQMLGADDYTDRHDMALVCLAERWSCMLPRVTGPGGLYTHRRLLAARTLGEAMLALEGEESVLRARLEAAADALRELEAGETGLPESLAEWRQLMLNELDAEIFLIDLLRDEYADTDCKISRPG
ncbi:hypothetical protein [Marinovum sp.]|uniref:hypothetical protein n=1 Tax=Marinovum sp. TaxID=2024839 RepID=UPI002B27381C|nr:hypothetical protein [Marinovum sp.]